MCQTLVWNKSTRHIRKANRRKPSVAAPAKMDPMTKNELALHWRKLLKTSQETTKKYRSRRVTALPVPYKGRGKSSVIYRRTILGLCLFKIPRSRTQTYSIWSRSIRQIRSRLSSKALWIRRRSLNSFISSNRKALSWWVENFCLVQRISWI